MPDLDPIPDDSPDVVLSVRRHLASLTPVTSVVGSSDHYPNWIFRWRPYVDVEGTGSALIVVRLAGGWTSPNSYNTSRFPTLQLEVLADADRATDLNPSKATGAEDRAWAVYKAFDPYLHLVDAGGDTYFDDLRIITSTRLAEPAPLEVPGRDGIVNLIVRYALTL